MSRSAGVQDLVVDAMSARLLGVPSTPEAHEWLGRTAGAVANEHLPRALSGTPLPAGHWFIPRLELELRCPGVGGLPTIADDWSRAIIDTITTSLSVDAEWVHFATDTDLVVAVVVGAVTGVTEQHWAWVQAGLPEQALTSGSTADVVMAALRLHPEVAVAAFVRAAGTCGVAALDRALGESGWSGVADVLGARVSPADETAPKAPAPGGAGPMDRARAAALLDASSFGRLVLGSRLRPSRSTAGLWAWLVVAEVEPALLPSSPAHVSAVRHLVEARLAGRSDDTGTPTSRPSPTPGSEGPTRGTPTTGPARDEGGHDVEGRSPARRPSEDRAVGGRPTAHVTTRAAPSSAVDEPERMPAADLRSGTAQSAPRPDEVTADAGASTEWAGLLFLLSTAPAAGLPGCVDADHALAVRGVRWSAWRAGVALTHARPDDPAVLALGGLGPEQAGLVLDQPRPTLEEARSVARLAVRWRRATLTRLLAAPLGSEAVPASRASAWGWLVRRPGEVLATPGWIDVVLPLSSVDTAVRSAGLDLDPGFVPWLGTVVELRYG